MLESECDIAVNWLCNNKLIVNPDIFQLSLLDKNIGNKTIKSTSFVNFYGFKLMIN